MLAHDITKSLDMVPVEHVNYETNGHFGDRCVDVFQSCKKNFVLFVLILMPDRNYFVWPILYGSFFRLTSNRFRIDTTLVSTLE